MNVNNTELALSILDNEQLVEAFPAEETERLCELADTLIMLIKGASDEEQRAVEKRILDIYESHRGMLDREDGVVPYSYIWDAVNEHNNEIFMDMAYTEYYYGPQHYYKDYLERCQEEGIDPSEGFDEIPDQMTGEWEELYYTEYSDMDLDKYVAFVLNKYKMAYSFEKFDVPYDDTNASSIIFKNKSAIFVANDCQNAIMPEFMYCGFSGCSDYMNHHQEYDMSGRLLGSGH